MEAIVVEAGQTLVSVADGLLSVQEALRDVGTVAEVEAATRRPRQARHPAVRQSAAAAAAGD